LPANIYLHYAFDLWAEGWRRKIARGDVLMVRFADDIVVGFQEKAEAERFWNELKERMKKFDLELHPEKYSSKRSNEYALLHETTDGTPQGGIISPALANCALDGLERLL